MCGPLSSYRILYAEPDYSSPRPCIARKLLEWEKCRNFGEKNRWNWRLLSSRNRSESFLCPSTVIRFTESPRIEFFLMYDTAMSTAWEACSLSTSLMNTWGSQFNNTNELIDREGHLTKYPGTYTHWSFVASKQRSAGDIPPRLICTFPNEGDERIHTCQGQPCQMWFIASMISECKTSPFFLVSSTNGDGLNGWRPTHEHL